MPDTASQRALTYLGFRPPRADQLGAPRSWFERVGVPGADSSPTEIVVGAAFLAVLVLAWVAIAASDTFLVVRILSAAAVAVDLVMIVARLRYLLERRG